EEDSGLSDEEQERKRPKNRPKHTRKRIHQAKKNFLEKFKTASEIRIYTTNIPARDRRVTLMQDPVYRSYIAHRSMGYPQSPVPSYYLGE
ncbi:hypothetical protein, partial [Bacteroides gallinaceum]|uniref:rhamnogalacturonan lyase family protein n=1 Tax=Bacteroides gallinaceum TaxID=1462571 RepID=UPI00195CD519